MSLSADDVFVFNSSAFINGANHHYYIATMRAVWTLVEVAIEDGRVVVPREVYREVLAQEDEISKLLAGHTAAVKYPSQEVQKHAGQLQQQFFQEAAGLHHKADPWVMAEAAHREAIVVTYEGITFSGAPAKGADKKLPALCKKIGVDCCMLAQALEDLGLSLG
jgi:hypothetical protein